MATRIGPQDVSWVVSIHASRDDYTPVGAGVVIDVDRVIASRHVVDDIAPGSLWVGFPMARRLPTTRVREAHRAVPDAPIAVADVVVIHLEGGIPTGVRPARLRFPSGGDVVGRRWWAFGFPDGDPRGNAADGEIGSDLGHGWLRLDTASRYEIEAGFSGAGVWCPDYDSVIALVGSANSRGDAQAFSLDAADAALVSERLAVLSEWSVHDVGDDALEQWGWRLSDDPEAARHWHPRSRGVAVESERGHRFRGRSAALWEIVAWLDRPVPDRRVLVVTGSPGVGKSAVLGRVVTTADPTFRRLLPADDTAVRATVGSVACAVHAKGKTALDVATEVMRAASARIPGRVDDAVPALAGVLRRRRVRRFNVVIDALDEAATPTDAREIVHGLVVPMAESCADVGVQVVVGTRASDDHGSLLDAIGPGRRVIDLDRAGYFELADLVDYAHACLTVEGDQRATNPYADEMAARPLAVAIAERSDRNFLIAALTARRHGLHDDEPITPEQLDLTPTLGDALEGYIRRLPSVGDVTAGEAMSALAYAEPPGFTVELWACAIAALHGARVGTQALARFIRSSAANFLLEETGPGDVSSFRLFHQALNDTLLANRRQIVSERVDQAALARGFIAHGRRAGWENVDEYLRQSLPNHALRGDVVDDLLADDDYLLHADILRLVPAARAARTDGGRRRCRLLRFTPTAAQAGPAERAALFSVTNMLDRLELSSVPSHPRMPYRARWSTARPRIELFTFSGHIGGVTALCRLAVGGRTVLASAGVDGTTRLWDPATGQATGEPITGVTGWVNALCCLTIGDRTALVLGGDGRVQLYDPATRNWIGRPITAHTSWVNALCAVHFDGVDLLASAGSGGTIRLSDPATGEALGQPMTGHDSWVNALCAIQVDGQVQLASASGDGTVRLWDPTTARAHGPSLVGHSGGVTALHEVKANGKVLLASAGVDGTVRLWDPTTGRAHGTPLTGHNGAVVAVCSVRVGGRVLLASAGVDGTVRLWDPTTGLEEGPPFTGHVEGVTALCAVDVDGRTLLASASDDGTVRVWDPAPETSDRDGQTAQPEAITALCGIDVDGGRVIAAGGSDGTIRLWDEDSGRNRGRPMGQGSSRITALCAVEAGGESLLASAGEDGTVTLWDPASAQAHDVLLTGHVGGVTALCTLEVDDPPLLASGGTDGTVRLWSPATGRRQGPILGGHVGGVTALSGLGTLLASASGDGTVRLWEPLAGWVPHPAFTEPAGSVTAFCSLELGDRTVLVSASGEGLRVWDPVTGHRRDLARGAGMGVVGATALCAVAVEGRILLASAGGATVRAWDPVAGRLECEVPTHHAASAITSAGRGVTVGTTAGLLTVDLFGPPLGRGLRNVRT